MRYLVISSMRDEGAFLLEWVCWYRMLGFTDILILTNDCSDHSPALLDALAAAGWVTHIPHKIPAGGIPLRAKLRRARREAVVGQADWILVCDVDEFLVVHRGAGRIADLLPLPARAAGFLGMSINWKVFGTGGEQFWTAEHVHRRFHRCAAEGHGTNRWFKAAFARPELFQRFGAHGPSGWKAGSGEEGGPSWGRSGALWVNSAGRPMLEWHPEGPYQRMTETALTTHAAAQINHYMLRSCESFGLKRGTLSAAALKDRYTEEFFLRYDRNEAEDHSALRYREAFDTIHAEAMALPGVARLHHLCCADYVARLCRRAEVAAESDPRYAAALQAAASYG